MKCSIQVIKHQLKVVLQLGGPEINHVLVTMSYFLYTKNAFMHLIQFIKNFSLINY